MISVAEQYAGQMMKCPFCNGTFTAPSLPQAPAAGPGPGASATPLPPAPGGASPADFSSAASMAASPGTPGIGAEFAELESQAKTAPPPGYTHSATFRVNPVVVPWIAPVALLLFFFLLFFPWCGAYPGGYGVYTQNGWQGLWGGFSADAVGQKVLKQDKDQDVTNEVRPSTLSILFLVLFLPGLVSAWVPIIMPHIQWTAPPAMQQLITWQPWISRGLVGAAFLVIVLQLLVGFGLENAATFATEQQFPEPAGATPEELQRIVVARGADLGRLVMRRTVWLRGAVTLYVIAVAGMGLEFWLHQRGKRPVPRVEVMW
jgi:hypothetical protein